jgi:hypothetical protein
MIVTTNLRFSEWGSVMAGDERMSAALLDRLTHRAHILEFRGTSYRFRQQLLQSELSGAVRERGGAGEVEEARPAPAAGNGPQGLPSVQTEVEAGEPE